MKFQKIQKIIFLVFISLIVGSLIGYKFGADNLDVDLVENEIKSFGIWAPFVFIMLYTITTFFLPSTPFMIIAGVIFGLKIGLVYVIIGGTISSISLFQISRYLGKNWVEDILQKRYFSHLGEYNKRLESGAIFDLVLFRLMPIMPFNVLNILMGVSRIKIGEYIIGTILGLLPSSILSVFFGDLLLKFFKIL